MAGGRIEDQRTRALDRARRRSPSSPSAGSSSGGRSLPREGTDDAQVSGHVSPVATRVGGTVRRDRSGRQPGGEGRRRARRARSARLPTRRRRAEADLAGGRSRRARGAQRRADHRRAARAAVSRSRTSATGNADAGLLAAEREVEASRAKVASAEARLAEAQARARRAPARIWRGWRRSRPRTRFRASSSTRPRPTKQAADAAVASAEAAVREAKANLDVAEARRAQAAGRRDAGAVAGRRRRPRRRSRSRSSRRAPPAPRPRCCWRKAALDQARLNLERTVVRAPRTASSAGARSSSARSCRPGQPLMAITSLHDVWVTANFKETQLALDAAGPARRDRGRRLRRPRDTPGRVESIAAATGATFSLLPPDNSSGNFVKVVQRVPVKIVLDTLQDASRRAAPRHVGQRHGVPALTGRPEPVTSQSACRRRRAVRRDVRRRRRRCRARWFILARPDHRRRSWKCSTRRSSTSRCRRWPATSARRARRWRGSARSYILANVIVLPMTAFFTETFGRKRYLTFSIVLFVVASILCGTATSLGQLVFWRLRAGRRRRGAAVDRAGDAAPDLSARGAGHGAVDLPARRHRRADARPDARRLHHRQRQLALVLLHQPADRHRCRRSSSRRSCTIRRIRAPHRQRGLVRHCAAGRRRRLAAVRARRRQHQGLVLEPAAGLPGGRVGDRARRCSSGGSCRRETGIR